MKKLMLFALAAFVLTSCDNLKKDKDEKDETAKMKKPLKDDSEEEEETASKSKNDDEMSEEEDTKTVSRKSDAEESKTASYSDGWSKENQENFMTTCVDKAKASMGESKATNYCSCMLTKIEELYPNAEEVSKLTMEKTTELAKECLSQ